MPRTVSDDEYAFLQNRRMTADFVESIYNDPQLNKEAKRLIKQVYPQARIPDYEIEEKIDTRFAEEQKKREEAAAAARNAAQEAQWKDERNATQQKYGFTEEGMQKL